ncbi:MAG: FAD-dependent oxidoreductase [Chloroflexi bacterium]|nr:FAD-dependent oxidoreductase [Chloroflexota bacterium]
MSRVVVIGGGWSGCAAAAAASKLGVETILLERTDYLLGVGNLAGMCDIDGEKTAVMECDEMGGGEIFEATRQAALHRLEIPIPHLQGTLLYDIYHAESNVKGLLQDLKVTVRYNTRAVDVILDNPAAIGALKLDGGEVIEAEAFVDATGGSGPQAVCRNHGRGCVLCIVRCPVHGKRVSIAEKAGIIEGRARQKGGGFGSVSNSSMFIPESLSEEVRNRIRKEGVVLFPAPEGLGERELFRKMRTQQLLSGRSEFEDYMVLVDNGAIKAVSRPWINLRVLREIPGFENAAFFDPLVPGRGNGIRFMAVTPRNDSLQVKGMDNLFCAGEKLLLVGVDTVAISGLLAGHNAARAALALSPVELPRDTAVGEGLAWIGERLQSEEGWFHKYSYQGTGGVLQRLEERGLYSTDRAVVRDRIASLGLTNLFDRIP